MGEQGADAVMDALARVENAARDGDSLIIWHWLDRLSDAITDLVRERERVRPVVKASMAYRSKPDTKRWIEWRSATDDYIAATAPLDGGQEHP